MKILLIMPISTTDWGSKNAGGVDTVCQLLIQQLIKNNNEEFHYRILAIDPFFENKYTGVINKLSENVELVYIPASGKILNKLKIPSFIWQSFHILKEMRKYSAQIVHSHMASWLILVSNKACRIATLHGYKKIARKSVGFWNDILYEKIFPALSDCYIDRYTCVGNIILEVISKDSEKKVTIIGNPVGDAYFEAVTSRKNEKIVIVTCAVLTPRKKIEHSIELVNTLKKSGCEVLLKIIGPESDRAYVCNLKKLVTSLGLEKNIHFTGALNETQIVDAYSNADLGVFLSAQETFGLVPMEMLAAGLPVIATRVGIIGEREADFSKFGVVFSADGEIDINSFHNLLKIDTTKAKNYILENFSVQSVVDNYESLYREYLNDV